MTESTDLNTSNNDNNKNNKSNNPLAVIKPDVLLV